MVAKLLLKLLLLTRLHAVGLGRALPINHYRYPCLRRVVKIHSIRRPSALSNAQRNIYRTCPFWHRERNTGAAFVIFNEDWSAAAQHSLPARPLMPSTLSYLLGFREPAEPTATSSHPHLGTLRSDASPAFKIEPDGLLSFILRNRRR
jgi:hypothetical protein